MKSAPKIPEVSVAAPFRSVQLVASQIPVVALYAGVFLVALPAFVWRLGEALDRSFGLPSLGAVRWFGWVLLALGLPLVAASMTWLTQRGEGLPISSLPPRKLVASGPYAWVRHPIYVGFTLALAGAGLAAGSIGHGLLAPLLLAVGCSLYVLTYEEPDLVRRYGADYRAFSRTVPLLPIPSWTGRLARSLWARARAPIEWVANATVLFRVGPTVWVTYGLFVAIAASLVAFLGAMALGPILSSAQYAAYSIGLALAMPLGGRLLALAYDFKLLTERPLAALRKIGFVSWGGYLALIAFTLTFAAIARVPGLVVLDRILPIFLLASAIGRVGCLTYGCCYGRVSRHGIRWTHAEAKPIRLCGPELGSQPRIPTQLLSALTAFLVAAFAWLLATRGGPPGLATALGTLTYCFGRFAVEHFREEPRFGPQRWTGGQWACLVFAAGAFALLLGLESLLGSAGRDPVGDRTPPAPGLGNRGRPGVPGLRPSLAPRRPRLVKRRISMGYLFQKLYADHVSEDGTVHILYLAALELLGTRSMFAGVERYSPLGVREVLQAKAPPSVALESSSGSDFAVSIETSAGPITFAYRALNGGFAPETDPCEGLRWSVRAARTEARVRSVAGGVLTERPGAGYVDFVELRRPTRRLGLRSIDWGRVHLGPSTLVWNRLAFRDGRCWEQALRWALPGSAPELLARLPDRLSLASSARAESGCGARLEGERVLHEGAAIDDRRFPNAPTRWITQALTGRAQERRCLGRLGRPDSKPSAGWGIYETVQFDRQS